MTYSIQVTKDAAKELREFPAGVRDSLLEATKLIGADPFSKELHGRTKILKGYEYIYRFEDGNRRIFYTADPETREVVVLAYSRRNDLYDKSTLRTLDAVDKAEKRRRGFTEALARLAAFMDD